eukprot:576554-Hanusia_phi.AAC.2
MIRVKQELYSTCVHWRAWSGAVKSMKQLCEEDCGMKKNMSTEMSAWQRSNRSAGTDLLSETWLV